LEGPFGEVDGEILEEDVGLLELKVAVTPGDELVGTFVGKFGVNTGDTDGSCELKEVGKLGIPLVEPVEANAGTLPERLLWKACVGTFVALELLVCLIPTAPNEG
jgi:hypothetical protein